MVQNRALIYKAYPDGPVVAGKHLVVETSTFDLDGPAPPGGVVTKNAYLSYDPYQRGKMRDPTKTKSYTPAFEIGKPLSNFAIAKVVKSDSPRFKPGDVVLGFLNVEEYSALDEAQTKGLRPLENPYHLDPKVFLGALGMPGLTAYGSLKEIAQPKKGETILVSAASGAVGQLVGQLAKLEGLRVFGSVGSDEKLDFITKKLGFDGGFNYKKEKPADALPRLFPEGLDLYYDNVGGELLDNVFLNMKPFGRIVACGSVSQYDKSPESTYGLKNNAMITRMRLKIQGFVAFDENISKHQPEQQKNMAKWLAEGKLVAQTSVTDGFDNAIEGFVGMLAGRNFGKAVLKIAELD